VGSYLHPHLQHTVCHPTPNFTPSWPHPPALQPAEGTTYTFTFSAQLVITRYTLRYKQEARSTRPQLFDYNLGTYNESLSAPGRQVRAEAWERPQERGREWWASGGKPERKPVGTGAPGE